MSESGHIVHL
jgi:PadR family transcriptional regulator PadR